MIYVNRNTHKYVMNYNVCTFTVGHGGLAIKYKDEIKHFKIFKDVRANLGMILALKNHLQPSFKVTVNSENESFTIAISQHDLQTKTGFCS